MLLCNQRSNQKYKIYIAAPLFSEAEREFNENVASKLKTSFHVYLPQRDGGLVSEMIQNGIASDEAVQRVFHGDMEAILDADYLVAILDGRTIDEGVAFELGIAYALSKRCIGIQTDTRRLASWGNNPMIAGALEKIFQTTDEFLVWIEKESSGQFTSTPASGTDALRRTRPLAT